MVGKMDTKDRVKLALAIACLRLKPSGVSGWTYAQELCDKFKASQIQYKKRLAKAETEIITLRQQLVLKEAAILPRKDGDSLDPSQELFSTPPASGHVCDSVSFPNASLAKHTTFLHHVINLQSKSSRISPEIDRLTIDSIINSLNLLSSFLGQETYSWSLQNECVTCIVNVCEKINGRQSNHIQDQMIDLCQHIIQLVTNAEANQFKPQQERTQILVKLGSCAKIADKVLDTLCYQVSCSIDQLQPFILHRQNLDPKCYLNIYYILDALDKILVNCCEALGDQKKATVKRHLDEAILRVANYFPLYAHFLLRICAKIK